MASATFENGPAVRAARAAIWSERARRRSAQARRSRRRDRREGVRPSGRAQSGGALWRGVGASAAIAGGYVAAIAGLRWVLAATL